MARKKENSVAALRERPKMIVAGFSAYSREIDWQKFKDIADEIGAYTFADIAHIAGLIAGKQIKNPVPIFDVASTTTHKTLRGPRGALIMSKKIEKKIANAILEVHNNIKTVVKKASEHKGEFRIQKTKHLSGKRNKITTHKESGINLKLNITID